MVALTAQSQASLAEDRPCLLLVGSEGQSRDNMLRALTERFEVHCACDTHGALSVLQTTSIDTVLLDSIHTSASSGFDILDAIRHNPATHDLPVILCAHPGDESYLIKGFAHGATDYLSASLDDRLSLARIQAQVTLKRKLDDQQQMIRALKAQHSNHRRLLRMVGHDLKTPLANVSLGESLLRYYTDTCSDMTPILDGMSAAIDTMRDVLEDFSNAAAVHEISIRLETIPAERVIYDAALQYSTAACAKNITLDIEEAPGWVLADRNRLNQIVGNLLSNAIKYSPPDTTIRLGAARQQHAIRLYVTDEGPGVIEAERDLLFTEFGRASNVPTGSETSTGLGLWIVRKLTEAMGGRCGADFSAAQGSTFWVDLPQTVPLTG